MTIQVQNEVVTLQHSSTQQWEFQEDDQFLRHRKKSNEDDDLTAATAESSKDSDDDSIVSSVSSTITQSNKVSFCEELVTEKWTRPYTEPEDIPHLYYSTDETNRFRQEYRLERKVLTSPDFDEVLLMSDDEASDCSSIRRPGTVCNSYCNSSDTDASCPCLSDTTSSRRSISRVVVLHNDKIESFSDSFCTNKMIAPDFFDTPEFWSGSITWW